MPKQINITAYCYRCGQIKFSNDPPCPKRWKLPNGALHLVTGPEQQVRKIIGVLARTSYPSKRGGTDTVPLVPGVPEATDFDQALEACSRFIKQINARFLPPWFDAFKAAFQKCPGSSQPRVGSRATVDVEKHVTKTCYVIEIQFHRGAGFHPILLPNGKWYFDTAEERDKVYTALLR